MRWIGGGQRRINEIDGKLAEVLIECVSHSNGVSMKKVDVDLVCIENGVLCKPSEGYAETASVELASLIKVGTMGGKALPKVAASFPLGAPVPGLCVYNGDVYAIKM